MIIAETTASVTAYADRYDFIGPEPFKEVVNVLQSARGLAETGMLEVDRYDALHAALPPGTTHIVNNRLAVQGLHHALYRFEVGLARYHDNRNLPWDTAMDVPMVAGIDGLSRVANDGGLEMLIYSPQEVGGEKLSAAAAPLGATHATYQFALPEDYRSVNHELLDHVSLGTMGNGQFRPIATVLDHTRSPRSNDNPQQVAQLRNMVTTAPPVITTGPRHYQV